MSLSNQKNLKLYEKLIETGIKKANNKDFISAEEDFSKAIKLDNKNQMAHINLSNIYIIQKKINKAVKILMDYIYKYKNNKMILNHTAKLLYTYNLKDDLLELFHQAKLNLKKNNNKNYYLYFIKGLYHEKEENYQSAKESFFRSISYNATYFEGYIKLLNLYEQTNEFKKLNKLINKAFDNFFNQDKICILLFYKSLLLSREKKFKDSQKIIIENNLRIKLKNSKNFFHKLLDLEAKNNEKLKNYKLAFQNIKERNNILLNLSENKNFDGKNIYNSIEKYKIFFTRSNLEKINSKINYQNDENLVFLIGFPRSGTTLLDSILRSHSEITVLEEKPYLLNLRHDFFKQNDNNLSSLLNITQDIRDKIRNEYFKKIFSQIGKNKTIIIDKFPLTIIELGFVKCIFPNAKIILAMRHPCDVVTSCFFSSFKINDAMVNFLSWSSTIQFYNKVFDLFEFYSNEMNLSFIMIKYEDLITNFKSNVLKMTKYIGLEYESDMENFFITAKNRSRISTPSYSQVINPLYTTSINRWKNYPNTHETQKKLNKWIKKFSY
ncbi:sulfotransferase [Pelagibacteraceae bacterium]|nr:sulfotransferase [Pelagibacteraceae bacterium]